MAFLVLMLLNNQANRRSTPSSFGYGPAPKPSWRDRLFYGFVVGVVVFAIAAIVAVIIQGSREAQADRVAWEQGLGHPQAVELQRGSDALRSVPQTIDTVNQWWTKCRRNFCYSQSIEHYPAVFRAGTIRLGENCVVINTGSTASSVMVASTKGGGSYIASFAASGDLKLCVGANNDDDKIVVWTSS